MNPWINLQTGSNCYILEQDYPYVLAHNQSCRNASHVIKVDRMPEPRMGPVNAPIVILQLNPSHGEVAPTLNEIAAAYQALCDENSSHFCFTQNNSWWARRYRTLIADFGNETVAKKICSIEFFPYASKQFGHAHIRLPSQTYTFDLVRSALERQAIIIVTRGYNLWAGAIPELVRNRNVYTVRNFRSASISDGNLPSGVLGLIREKLAA